MKDNNIRDKNTEGILKLQTNYIRILNSLKCCFVVILLSILTISTISAKEEIINFESDLDTSFLPYRTILIDEAVLEKSAFHILNPIEISSPIIENTEDAVYYLARNSGISNSYPSSFSTVLYPDRKVLDDDPINYTITNWKLYNCSNSSKTYILGICHNSDSIFAFKLNPDNDKIDYKLIYSKENVNSKDLVPFAFVGYTGNYGYNNEDIVLFYIQDHNNFRKLFCFNLNSWQKIWDLNVSSGIMFKRDFHVFEDSINPRIIFTTINPANEMHDSSYVDFNSYLTILNIDGIILSNKTVGNYPFQAPIIRRGETDSVLYLIHLKEPNDTTVIQKLNNSPKFKLSKIDYNGIFIRSVEIEDYPSYSFFISMDKIHKNYIVVQTTSKYLSFYDTNLNYIGKTTKLNHSLKLLSKTKIKGENDSVFVFNDGIYNANLTKILNFPLIYSKFIPLSYDIIGNITTYAITTENRVFIGKIQRKTFLELASVFYHNNQIYILMSLSGLLVGLFLTAIYQRRTKKNLNLISSQKMELEKAHQELKNTQLKLIEAEKYKQAKDIAGGFAHEIRNALFPVDGSLNKLFKINKPEQYDRERFEEYFEKIKRSTNRAISMTELISQYTKLDSEYIPESVIISKIINEVIEENQAKIDEQNIKIKINGDTEAAVESNQQQLFIVFNNLLLNSLDALTKRDNCLIFVKWWYDRGVLNLVFEDNGAGISSDNIDNIFDTFFSTKPTRGTGIGLSMIRKIVEMYSGTITVSSKENIGTKFELTFKVPTN